MTIANRFRRFVAAGGDDECWLWMGATSPKGYGQFHARGKTEQAHRVAWRLEFGEIPAGIQVLHRCDVRCCVNPAHLFLGSNADNNADMMAKGRHSYVPRNTGNANAGRKILADDAREIRKLRGAGSPIADLAAEFGVTARHVRKIVAGEFWRTA